jgi:hypothetical protein
MRVVLQYFDDCPNWKEAEAHIETLRAEGFDVELDRQLIDTPKAAEQYGFRGSPTILIDGADPFADRDAPIGLSCRVYRTEGGYTGSPSLDQVRAVLQAAS